MSGDYDDMADTLELKIENFLNRKNRQFRQQDRF